MSRLASYSICVLGVAAGALVLRMSFIWAGTDGAPLFVGESLWAIRAAAVASIICAPILAWGGWEREPPTWMSYALIGGGYIGLPCLIFGAKLASAPLSWLGVIISVVASLTPAIRRWATSRATT